MVEACGADVEAIPNWVFHDLRSRPPAAWPRIGIAPHVVEAVLGHKSGTIRGVAAVYNRYRTTLEAQRLDASARRLDAIITGAAASNVVELAKERA